MTSDTAAIVLASGTGQRMAKGINKVLLELLGKPLLFHTLQKLKQCSSIGQIVVVISNNDANQLRKEWGPETLEMADVQVEGGEERWISCKNGCQISNEKLPFILVQDAARAPARRALRRLPPHAAALRLRLRRHLGARLPRP